MSGPNYFINFSQFISNLLCFATLHSRNFRIYSQPNPEEINLKITLKKKQKFFCIFSL